ncbi:MAG: hypothetical protein JXB17_01945 [Bacteroidales bacterium]|nr:hypothetical protein [Bacteroidales bacterium]
MTNRVKVEVYKGKKIIFLDYTKVSHHEEDKFLKELDEIRQFILGAGKDLLILVDVTGSFASQKMVQRMREDGKIEKPFIKKEAVVGVTGLKEVLLKGINLFTNLGIKPFNSINEAKEWLVQ